MADWSKNNRACTTLWTSLFTMHELNTNFENSSNLVMRDLTFFNPLNSAGMRLQEATTIADHLDNVFIIGRGAKYEENCNRIDAIQKMVEVLVDESKTVQDLASVVDDRYLFWGE